MREALALAREAESDDEVPVGAVVVHDGRVVGRGANRQIRDADPTAHAEMLALRQAAHELGDYRLRGATLYVTLEPCAMCAGALVTARVAGLVFGSRDLRFGAVRSKFRLADSELLNHRLEIEEGVLAGRVLGAIAILLPKAAKWRGCAWRFQFVNLYLKHQSLRRPCRPSRLRPAAGLRASTAPR